MAKSYVPQLARLLTRICVYITKHQSTMAPYLNAQQQAALQSIVSACAAFGAVTIRETP